jgi:hypothetical protein
MKSAAYIEMWPRKGAVSPSSAPPRYAREFGSLCARPVSGDQGGGSMLHPVAYPARPSPSELRTYRRALLYVALR